MYVTGLPASVVLPWVAGRLTLDDQYCWNVNEHNAVYYLLRIPIIITVLVSGNNFKPNSDVGP